MHIEIEICAGGWNVGDGPTGKKDVELFFSGALNRLPADWSSAEKRLGCSVSLSKYAAGALLSSTSRSLNPNWLNLSKLITLKQWFWSVEISVGFCR